MTCPKCHAQLLPMQSEYFCLQCGEVVARTTQSPEQSVKLEDTADPLLRRAINDVSERPVVFVDHIEPLKENPSQPKTADISMPVALAITTPIPAEAPAPVKPRLSSGPLVNLLKPKPLNEPTATPVVAQALHGAHQHTKKPACPHNHHRIKQLGLVAVGVLVLVSVVNASLAWYLHNRVYPGVRVAGLELGGQSLSQATSTVSKTNQLGAITLVIDSTTFKLDPKELGVTVDEAGAISKAQAIGHSEAVPLVGLYRSLQSSSVVPGLKIDQERLSAVVSQLGSSISHPATNAHVIMSGTTPVVITDKPGQSVSVDELRTAVIKAITTNEKVVINTTKVTAQTPATVYGELVAKLQSRIALTIKLSIRGKSTSVTSQQIASWLRWNDAGTSVTVDSAGVQAYVASLPGSFDRRAVAGAIATAITNAKNTTITASTKKITTIAASAVTPLPTIQYNYCVSEMGVGDDQLAAFADKLTGIYTKADGWSLGGRIIYVASATDCNYTVNLVAATEMARFSQACDNQSTCRVGNDIIINNDRWKQAPPSWKGTQEQYQVELINHETGHWLGFDHAACGISAPPISQTLVTVAGCSASWWAIAPQLQTLKILPGF